MPLLLKHQTAQQFVNRMREAFRTAPADRALVIARFVQARVQVGDITDAQCRAAWGLNAGQWTALKAKMKNWTDADAVIRSAAGE